jgi:endonuclease/exonuclease/phosphatase family metal-dependent hydrolase
MTTLRVVSYNLKDLTQDRQAAARVIRRLDPEVLCLQEVPRRLLSAWRVSAFAAECDLVWSGGHRGSGGTTILTSLRVQVEESSHRRLRVALGQRTRGYAVARVAVPGRLPVVVASVHLSLDAAERLRHTEQILGSLAQSERVVLAGDLNEGEAGAAWQRIGGPLRLVSPGRPTFPSRAPTAVLDVIFASPGLTTHVGDEAAPDETVLDEADLVAASDHRPVWVDLDLGPEG